jgi:hypothetical protein
MSGSALSAAVKTGDEKVFFCRGVDVGAEEVVGAGRLGVFVASESIEIGVLAVEALLLCEGVAVLSFEGMGFNGDLNGERKGLESVCDAASILRRLAAGVDILALC